MLLNRKSYTGFRLSYLHLTLGHSKGRVKLTQNFDCEYLVNDEKYSKYQADYFHHSERHVSAFHWHTITNSTKGNVKINPATKGLDFVNFARSLDAASVDP